MRSLTGVLNYFIKVIHRQIKKILDTINRLVIGLRYGVGRKRHARCGSNSTLSYGQITGKKGYKNMLITIHDFAGRPKTIKITKKVKFAYIIILSGDQVLTVHYEDGTKEKFDSSNNRITDYYDDDYEVKLEDGKDFGTYNYDGDNIQ